jgi:multiple sugar transport system permease protein
LYLSLTKWDLIGKAKFIGFKNYTSIFHDEDFWAALVHTVYFIIGYLPLVLLISLAIALLLNRKLKGIVVFRAIYFLPVVSSWVAVSMIWKWLLNPQYGVINYLLSLIGITGPAWLQDPKWAMFSVILASVWKDIGFVMVMFLAGLQGISEDYYEAAEIDGANPWQRFLKITVPLLAPTTFFVLIISMINSFQVFPQVWIMTQGGPAGATSVLVEQIYKNAFGYFKMGYASALSWVLFIIIFLFTFVQSRMQKRWAQYD